MKFGKKEARHDYKTLRLAEYFKPTLPPPSAAYSSIDEARRKLTAVGIGDQLLTQAKMLPCYGNDQYGNCAWTSYRKQVTILRGCIGLYDVGTDQEVIDAYLKYTGGKDEGTELLTQVKYLRNTTVFGTNILGFGIVDKNNPTEIKQAIELFKAVHTGFQVTDRTIPEFDARQPWDGRGSFLKEGHCVPYFGHSPKGYIAPTWNGVELAEPHFVSRCVDEIFVLFPPEAATPGFSEHWDFEKFNQAMKAFRSS